MQLPVPPWYGPVMRKPLLLALVAPFLASAAGAQEGGRIQVRVFGSVIDRTQGIVSSSYSNGPDGVSIDQPYIFPVDATLIGSDGGGGGSSYGFAGMKTAPGGVQVTVNGSVSAGAPNEFTVDASAISTATATLADSFRIDVPSLPFGEPLVLTAHVFTNTTLLANSTQYDSVYADWGQFIAPAGLAASESRWNATLRTMFFFETETTTSGYCRDDRDEHTCPFPPLGLDQELSATNGGVVWFELEVAASVALSARAWGIDPASGSVFASADGMSDVGGLAPSGSTVGSAAGWGGLTVTSQGNPVTEFTAISQYTGYDYKNTFTPVPEVGGGIAQALAIALLALRRARHSSRSDAIGSRRAARRAA